jgi:hypothetical protein
MAILSAVFGLIARQLSTILQAIFGWSITALFGKLPSKKQTALSVALILSVAWPLLVVGCFFPGAAAWALAFLPLHRWLGDLALRLVWIGLAVTVPLGVGAITRWITPRDKLHGPFVVTLLGGYVMTVGYFVAFVVTAVTVPIVKVLSAIHRWDDCHVYVQPKEGRYFEVLDALVEACDRAHAQVVREEVPAPMALASNVIQKLARRFLEPIVEAKPQRLRGQNLELYLYPADLLLRGDPHLVAHARAAMTRTELEKNAYLVESVEAQTMQDEIQTAWENARADSHVRAELHDRLRDMSRKLDRASISFDDWTTLENSLRRLERFVTGGPDLLEEGSDHPAAEVAAVGLGASERGDSSRSPGAPGTPSASRYETRGPRSPRRSPA